MGEIKVIRYECDVCRKQFKNKADFDACMETHRADEEITAVGREVVVDIGGPGAPSYMGGPLTDGDPEWVTGKVLKRRRGSDHDPECLIQLPDGSREWHSAWVLKEWAERKAAMEYREAHREEIEAAERNASGCTIIMTLPKGGTWTY